MDDIDHAYLRHDDMQPKQRSPVAKYARRCWLLVLGIISLYSLGTLFGTAVNRQSARFSTTFSTSPPKFYNPFRPLRGSVDTETNVTKAYFGTQIGGETIIVCTRLTREAFLEAHSDLKSSVLKPFGACTDAQVSSACANVTACKSALATPPLPDGWQWRFESTNQAGCLFKFSRFDFDDQSPCEYDTVLTLSGTSDTLRAILAVAFGVQLCVAIANMIWTRRVGSREFQRAQTEESSPPKSLYSRPGYAIRLAAQGPGLFYIAISQRRCDLLEISPPLSGKALVMQLASSAAGAIASVMAVFGAPLTFKTVILWITFASNSVAFLFKLSVALFTRRLWVREHDHLLQTNLFTKKPQTSSVPGQGADTSNRSAV